MPQDRLRSPRGSHGRRLTSLSDFEFRVWDQYQLSSDDFGVMRCSPLTIQADNDNLAERPAVDVHAALERLIAVGLVVAFEHQDRRYVCQDDWQTFQKVEYPRRTDLPKPPDAVLEKCDKPTRQLFNKYPGGFRKKRGKRPEGVPSTSRAHPDVAPSVPREHDEGEPTTCLKPLAVSRLPLAVSKSNSNQPVVNGSNYLAPIETQEVADRAAGFLERYPSIYAKVRSGAYYHVKHGRDYPYAIQLVDGWKDDQRLDTMAELFLRMNAKEANNVPGTPGQFLNMAPECDARLRENGR